MSFARPALVIILDTSLTTVPQMSAQSCRMLCALRAERLREGLVGEKYDAQVIICDTPEMFFGKIRQDPSRVKAVMIDKNIELPDDRGVKTVLFRGGVVKQQLQEEFPHIAAAIISFDREGVDFHKSHLFERALLVSQQNPIRNWVQSALQAAGVPFKPEIDFDAIRAGVQPAVDRPLKACALVIHHSAQAISLACRDIENPYIRLPADDKFMSDATKKVGLDFAAVLFAAAEKLQSGSGGRIKAEDLDVSKEMWKFYNAADANRQVWKEKTGCTDNHLSHDLYNEVQSATNSISLAKALIADMPQRGVET